MKYLLFFSLTFLLFCGCQGQPLPVQLQWEGISQSQQLPAQKMDSLAQVMGYVPDQVQFAIALLQDTTVQYYGFQRRADSLTAIENSDKVFEIGSISKVFTATLLAQQVQGGKLTLDSPIGQLLDLELKAGEGITLQQLANHTSGLPRVPSSMLMASLLHPDNPYKDFDEEALRKYLEEKVRLNDDPGERYSYSNLGVGLLAYILERQSHKSYEQLLREKVFVPLQMNSSSTKREAFNERLVSGLDKKGEPTANWDMAALAGAGAILSSPRDMARFCRAHFQDALPFLALSRQETFRVSERTSLALGWHILRRKDGHRWHWHNGGTGGYRTSLWLDLEQKKAVVLLTNLSAGHGAAGKIDALAQFLLAQSD